MAYPPHAGHNSEQGYLTGKILIAMPNMPDSRFSKSVIYLCAHSADGAMGLVINQTLPSVQFSELLEQLDLLPAEGVHSELPIHFGGPVESGRGFVLHSTDYICEGSMTVDQSVALTATIDILKDMAIGDGPKKKILALGYAGWGPGQLDQEIVDNGWLHTQADDNLLFELHNESKWERSIEKIGISPLMLSTEAGHA